MSLKHQSSTPGGNQSVFNRKLAAYLAATASGTLLAREAEAVIVSNSTVQPFGINGEVNIDFNGDTQIDFQIDHDRVDLGGGNFVDYLQLDKNDQTGASSGEDPLAIPAWEMGFPANGAPANDTAEFAHVVESTAGNQVYYPSALVEGQEIGADVSVFDFQEGNNTYSSGQIARANRLIDEDQNQVDTVLGGYTAADFYPIANTPQFVGLGGEVRYVGVKMDLQNMDVINYGWIGVRITNEEDATGEVVGWGYETETGVSILAGATAPGISGDFSGNGTVENADLTLLLDNWGAEVPPVPAGWSGAQPTAPAIDNDELTALLDNWGASAGSEASLHAVPEPSSLLLTVLGAIVLVGAFFVRRFRRAR